MAGMFDQSSFCTCGSFICVVTLLMCSLLVISLRVYVVTSNSVGHAVIMIQTGSTEWLQRGVYMVMMR